MDFISEHKGWHQADEKSRLFLRVGQLTVGAHGEFLEEGICEYLAREYLQAHRPEYYRAFMQTLIEQGWLSISGGDGALDDEVVSDLLSLAYDVPCSSNGNEFRLSLKNLDLSRKKELIIINPAIACQGLEILFSINQDLLPALIEARNSAVGLRKVVRILEGIENGLYRRLMSPPEMWEGYGGLVSPPVHFIKCLNYLVSLKEKIQTSKSS